MRCTFALILMLGLSVGCESDAPRSFKPLTPEQYREATRSRTRSKPSRQRTTDTAHYDARTYRLDAHKLPADYQKRLQSQSSTDPDGSPKANMPN